MGLLDEKVISAAIAAPNSTTGEKKSGPAAPRQALVAQSLTDDPHPRMSFPTEEYRLLGLFRFWNVISYFFPPFQSTGFCRPTRASTTSAATPARRSTSRSRTRSQVRPRQPDPLPRDVLGAERRPGQHADAARDRERAARAVRRGVRGALAARPSDGRLRGGRRRRVPRLGRVVVRHWGALVVDGGWSAW